MADIAPELLQKVQNSFRDNLNKSKKAAGLQAALHEGAAAYPEAYDYASEVGEALAAAYKEHISSDVLPDGKMYYNIAETVLQPTLADNYKLSADYAGGVQEALNKKAGLGLKNVRPALDQDRIDGIINRVSSEEHYDDVAWILQEPVKTMARSAVDATVKSNVDFHAKSGLSPKIVRRMVGGCCAWCANLAGEYSYPSVPKDVYRRHENCRCTVEYYPYDGRGIQNSHTKEWFQVDDEELTKRQNVGLPIEISYAKDVTKTYLQDSTPMRGNKTIDLTLHQPSHQKELSIADWLHKVFGGDITVRQESDRGKKQKNPDFLWDGVLWELKSLKTSNLNTIENRVRDGLHQIARNPGGLVLDYTASNLSLNDAQKITAEKIYKRINGDGIVDVIIKKGDAFKVLRIRK